MPSDPIRDALADAILWPHRYIPVSRINDPHAQRCADACIVALAKAGFTVTATPEPVQANAEPATATQAGAEGAGRNPIAVPGKGRYERDHA